MARSDWYRDRSDGLWTTEVDSTVTLILQTLFGGRYAGITGIVPQAPVSEGGIPAVTVQTFDDTQMTFKVVGSGGLVTFRIAFSGGQSDDLTLRFRSVAT